MKLVIVESPAKSKTIAHYLGEDYKVEASVGHVCDLSTSGKGGLGVDVDHDFKATYVVNPDKKEVVKKLTKLAKESDEVILATDPDREGEAIAYHLAKVLKLPLETTKRLEFHEITEDSIKQAINNPRNINMDLVHSQETRRIIDRIIGFKISSLINSRIKSKSAGRVQSVTLKLICDHEKSIKEFVPEEYWKLIPIILVNDKELELEFYTYNGKAVTLKSKEEADEILANCAKVVKVTKINKTNKSIQSKEPYRTSTLQQDASNKYKFKTKETASLAQRLYEGVELGEGLVGLITYMRTDSTKLSDTFISKANDYIIDNFGQEYCKGSVSHSKKKVVNAQDAHEAIRPTSIYRTPEQVKKYLTDHEYKLYKMIYERTLASLMKNKEIEVIQTIFSSNNVEFKYDYSKVLFKGYDILNLDEKEKKEFFDFNVGEQFNLKEIKEEQNFTKAPARYTEGRLVKLMEDEGIGRPSTYSSTIQTLISRKYIVNEKGVLVPTDQGVKTATVLTKYFPDLMNTEYTAEMETNLDKISTGEIDEIKVLNDFYNPFIVHFEEVKKIMYKDEPEYTGEICPQCGSKLVLRDGKHGKFVACSNFPKCHYIKKEEKEKPVEVGKNCPNCGAPLVYRFNKSGQKFIGCSNFPKCRYIESLENLEEEEKRICPKCGGTLIRRKGKIGYFYGCSNYPNCDYLEPIKSKKQ